MNKNLSLMRAFLIGTILFSASCNKEDEGLNPVEETLAISDPNSFLSSAEVEEISSAGIVYNFQYGGNGMIEDVEESFSFEEEEEGVTYLTEVASTYDLIYTANRLSSINVDAEISLSVTMEGETQVIAEESESYTIAIQYDSKRLLSSMTENHTEGDYVVKLERIYNSENKLLKETTYEDGEEIQHQTYEWDGFNVKKEEMFVQGDGSNGRKAAARTALLKKQALVSEGRKAALTRAALTRMAAEENTYADFDDKANPLNVLSLFGFSNGLFISNNNPGLVNFSNSEGNGSVEIAYTYDSKGRPTRYSVMDPEEGLVTIEVVYKN